MRKEKIYEILGENIYDKHHMKVLGSEVYYLRSWKILDILSLEIVAGI